MSETINITKKGWLKDNDGDKFAPKTLDELIYRLNEDGSYSSYKNYIENILRQMPFLNLMPTGNIKLSEVVSYLNAGAVAVGVGRDFYQGFTPREITNRTKEILNEVKDFSEWSKK